MEEIFSGESGSVRRVVFNRLLSWRNAARAKGLSGRVVLNGSFISAEEKPGDFDLLFLCDATSATIVQEDGEALALIDPIRSKQSYGGDVFACSASIIEAYPQFFPTNSFDRIKFTNVEKGVLEVEP